MIQILPITNNSIHFKMTFWRLNTFNTESVLCQWNDTKLTRKTYHVLRRSDPVHLGPNPDPQIRYQESWILIRILPSNFLNTVPLPLYWVFCNENRRIEIFSKHRRIWIWFTKKYRTKHGHRERHTFSEVTCTPPVVGHPPHLHSRAGRRWGSGAGTPVVWPPSALGRTAAAPQSPAGWAPE